MTRVLIQRPTPEIASMRSGQRAVAIAAGVALALIVTLPKALEVWVTGIFLNPDDAMRAVQVRDFLAGQAWFDLVPHRLSPDHPFAMHWSRLVDLPLASVVLAFRLVLSAANAELAMRLVTPPLFLVGALWAMTSIVRQLVGERAMVPAALLLGGSTEFVAGFIPGHIHHHGLQAMLLLIATAATLRSLGSSRASIGSACVAGATMAVSLGVGLQNLPFLMALCGLFGLAWIRHGESHAKALAAFGSVLVAASGVVFLLDVPPGSYRQGACDAFSAAHLVGFGGAGLAFTALAALSAGLDRPSRRALATAGAAAAVFAAVAASYPACLHDPMAGVDPLLRSEWLADVGEALPLLRLIQLGPGEGIVMLLTLICGMLATIAAWHAATPARKPQWLALLALGTVGVAGTVWQVRVAASTSAFLIPGVAWLACAVFDRIAQSPKRPALLLATLVGITANGAGLAAAAQALPRGREASSVGVQGGLAPADPTFCFRPAIYRKLAALPKGLVLSTIDPGSAILAATPHDVLAAPYHRNSYGIGVALRGLTLPPDEARPIVEASRATYVALCRGSNETAESVRLHPDSLSAALMANRAPAWLRPLSDAADPVQLFQVVANRPA